MIRYKKFQICELFDIHPTNAYKLTNAYLFDKDGTIPVVTNTSENHGRSGFSKLKSTEHDIITFSDTANKSPDSIYYQEGEFIGYSHVQGMYPYASEWTKYSLMYLVTLLRKKTKGLYDYYSKMSRDIISNMSIMLPICADDEIDFRYMEMFIKKMEDKGKLALKYALESEALNDNTLTEAEKDSIRIFNKTNKNFKRIKAKKLFKVKNNPQLNKNRFSFSDEGEYPYFTRTIFNNGVFGYVDYLDEEHKISGNSIAVGMMGMKFFYMEKDFYAGQFTKTVFPEFSEFDENIALYFITLLNKNSDIYLGGLVRDFEKLFYNTELYVPIKNGNIDLELIRNFIMAQKKLLTTNL